MMLAALAILVLGSPAASPELASVAGERRREGLRYESSADLVLRGTVLDQSGLPVPRALVYIEGWDEKHDKSDDVFRLRRRFPNQEGWLSIVVGVA